MFQEFFKTCLSSLTFLFYPDECSNSTLNNCAGNNTSNCVDTDGNFTCSCLAGYSGNGVSCVDTNECDSSPCYTNSSCINTFGSYSCQCNSGFYDAGGSCRGTQKICCVFSCARVHFFDRAIFDVENSFCNFWTKQVERVADVET